MRKLGLISSLLAALLLFPLTGFALGLGEIETSSFLNQPLKAEIEVFSARPGEVDDLLISLASRDAFKKAGLERAAGLSKLRFKVEKSEDGQTAKILVSTKKPIKEPFLSFLVEADWAKGRLLREFTILLDPVSFAQQTVQAATQVTPDQSTANQIIPQQADEAPAVEAQAVSSSEPAIAQPIAVSSSSEQDVPYVADSEYLAESSVDQVVVSKGDTLWGLASQFKDADHSMAQVMLALQMMNPDAFGKDNINNLKVGAVLRIPDMDVMDRLSKQEAYAQVLDQNGLWDEYVARKSGSPSTATADSTTAIGSSQQETESQLSLLTSDDSDSDSASLQNDANSENAGQIRKQLALAEEELEAAKLENDDLKTRIAMLEEQQSKFEELQNLVQIQDDSMAMLQQQTATEQEIVEDTMGAAEETSDAMVEFQSDEEKPSDVMIDAADEMLAENSEQEEVATEETSSMNEMMEEMQSTEAETVLQTTEEAGDEMVEEESMAQPEIATVPAPLIVTEAPDSMLGGDYTDMLPSLDSLLEDPVMLGGLAAILALILGLVFLKRKKSDQDDDGITLEESDALVDEDATPIHVPSSTQIDIPEDGTLAETASMDAEQPLVETIVSESADDDEEDQFASTAIISAEDMPTAEEIAPAQEEQDDVLNEVDVYLAYGLYDNAEDLLTESLQDSPERADYRAKLLDTYFATKNKEAFIKEADILKSLGGAADRFWDRIQIMGFELAPENELFSGAKDSGVSVEDLEYAKPETADFDIGADEEASDFSNTDFDLGSETFEISATQVMGGVDEEFSETQSMDGLDVDFPDLDESSEDEQKADDLPGDISAEELMLDDELIADLDDDLELGSDGDVAEQADINDIDISDEPDAVDELEIDLEEDDDAISFDLPDEMDIAAVDEEFAAAEIIELDPTVEAPIALDVVPDMDDDGLELKLADDIDVDTDLTSETVVLSANDLESAAAEAEKSNEAAEVSVESEEVDVEIPFDEDLDFDMSEMDKESLKTGDFTPSESTAISEVDLSEDDITEFRPADSTGEFDAFIAEATDEGALDEVDAMAGLDKTGTFAPGDFNEDDVADVLTDVDGIDGIEDLMLPDDVDEVGTKLDLAKAFIDMGDAEGARSSLEEVLTEGSDDQKAEATGLLDQIS